MIDIRVYNPQLQLQGLVDTFSSLIWIRRYQTPGEFELHVPYSERYRELLTPENIVQRSDGSESTEAGVIEHFDMTGSEIVVKGRFLESYLDRRLIKATTYYSGNVEDSMRSIISNMVAIPLLELGTDRGLEEELTFQATYKSVLSILEKVCLSTTYGFRIRPDFVARKLYFEVLAGNDLSGASGPLVVFSELYDNLLNESYSYDSTQLKTMAYVNQKIGDNVVAYSTGSGTGLDLREVAVGSNVDTSGRSTAQIKASMEAYGDEQLATKAICESFTFNTVDTPFVYRTDSDIGDIVQIRYSAWGINQSLRVNEAEEDYENGGRKVILTCGSPLPETVDFEEG